MQWFNREVHPHDGQLKAFVRGTYPSLGHEVDDVVQESYLRIWKTAAHQPIQSAKALLYLITRRVALNFLRKRHNSPFDPYGVEQASRVIEDKPDAAEAATTQDRIDLLADALMSLPPRCREIVVLHKINGLAQKEIAARLGLAPATVEKQVYLGVRRCHDYLRAHGVHSHHGHEA